MDNDQDNAQDNVTTMPAQHVGPERRMMLGSERKLDYLIIKNRGACVVGIKPVLYGSNKYGVAFSLRIRAAVMPSAPQPEKIKERVWKQEFSEIGWEQLSPERASCMIMIPTGLMFWEYDTMRERISGCADIFGTWLADAFNAELNHPQGDILDFIKDGWLEHVDAMRMALPLHPEIIPAEPEVHYALELFPSVSHATQDPGVVLNKASSVGKALMKEKLKLHVNPDMPQSNADADFSHVQGADYGEYTPPDHLHIVPDGKHTGE